MNPHSLPKKKELGAYYTPPELCQALADWAIQRGDNDILEPSFGGCGFFDSCISRLLELGCHSPELKLYGVDIDSHAFNILNTKFCTSIDTKQRFILDDFIQVKPSDFLVNRFDVVIGNPPYVSMHNMTEEQRKSCDRVLRNSPFSARTMGRNASLWAFFLLHSLDFLREGGRAAWVLPSSLMHADYAEKLIAIHQAHFSKLRIIKIADRFFKEEGAQETSVILLAEDFHREAEQKDNLVIRLVENIPELKDEIGRNTQNISSSIKNYKLDIVSNDAKSAYLQLIEKENIKPLGDYADIKIGMVTGANNQFIVNKSTAAKNNLPDDILVPVVGRFSQLKGIVHDLSRHRECAKRDQRVYLVSPKPEHMADKSTAVYRYLSQISDEDRAKNQTFKKRPYWFLPGWGVDGVKADCFLSYMIHHSPRMVVNSSMRFNCTNSIHKVIFRQKVSAEYKRAMSITMLSTFTQFSAELEGRAYSSGVLKIEPSAGRRIKVILSEQCISGLNHIKEKVEKSLEHDNFDAAAQFVDQVLINHGLITQEQCMHFAEAVKILRRERYKGVKTYLL